ncbi:MAG TPA: ATP-binding protein [Longimicrobiaceae bacterium]
MPSFFSPALEPSAVHGREAELSALAELLSARRRVVVHGPAGIGKTTLAAAAARRWREAGEAQQVIYLSLASCADAAWVVDAMGVLLTGPEFSALPRERRLPAVLKAVSSRPMVVVWDHLDRVLSSPWSGGLAALRPILELGVELTQAGRTRLIVVDREGDLGYVPYQPSRRVEVFGVGPLDAAGAGALAVGAAPALAERAVDAAGGNPLALRVLLAGGAGAPLMKGEPGDPLERALGRFWATLDESTRLGVSTLAPQLDGAVEDAWRSVSGADSDHSPVWMSLLERTGLAQGAPVPGVGRYVSFHDGLTAFLRPRVDARALAGAEERHRRTYMALAYEWSGGGSPWYPALVLRELPNLLVAFARTLEHDHDHVAALVDALQELLGPPPPEAPTLIERVLSTAEALDLAGVVG